MAGGSPRSGGSAGRPAASRPAGAGRIARRFRTGRHRSGPVPPRSRRAHDARMRCAPAAAEPACGRAACQFWPGVGAARRRCLMISQRQLDDLLDFQPPQLLKPVSPLRKTVSRASRHPQGRALIEICWSHDRVTFPFLAARQPMTAALGARVLSRGQAVPGLGSSTEPGGACPARVAAMESGPGAVSMAGSWSQDEDAAAARAMSSRTRRAQRARPASARRERGASWLRPVIGDRGRLPRPGSPDWHRGAAAGLPAVPRYPAPG